MSRIYFFVFTFLVLSKLSIAQTVYTWQVAGPVGDYQVATNWAPTRTTPAANDILAFNATADINVANVPNQTIGAIRILSGTNAVSFATNVATNVLSLSAATPLIYNTAGAVLAADLLTISLINAAAFTISSGKFGIVPSTGGKISINSALSLSGGTLDFDVPGTGGTIINSGGSITYNSGTFNSANITAITWANGANYYHAASGAAASAIPVSLWSGGSTCNITGMNAGTIAPTGFTTVNFANFSWNCAAQTGNVDLDFGGVGMNVTGTFTIASTGGGTNAVRLTGTGAVSVSAGAYSQTGGSFVLQSSTGTTVFTVTGAFSQTGGTIDFAGSGASAGIAVLNLKGNVTQTAAGTWKSTSTNAGAQMAVQFSGNVTQTVSILGTWNNPLGGVCNIANSNTDALGVALAAGTILKVYNKNSGTPATCTNGGNFSGAGSISYGGAAGFLNYSLIYNGTVPQLGSAIEFPSSGGPVNLAINNSSGVTLPASFSRTVPNTFTMTAGNLSIGSGNTLTLSNASLSTQLVYTAGNITSGTLSRYFPNTSLPTSPTVNARFPLGSGANDRSIYVYFSAATVSAGDYISVSHSAVVNATAIGTPFTDNGSLLDKRTNSNWTIGTGAAFNLGATTISVLAQATNIGSVDNISTLRLTDAVAGFGTLIATTGTTDAPLVGKSGLVLADINGKTLYVGSDIINALQIVTFTWTGLGNTIWANAANWTGGVGYPSAPTEVAIINTVAGNMPVIGSGFAISVYQLTVGASASFTMTGTGSISVTDNVAISGTVSFDPTSTFTYSSSNAAQNILDLPYGNLAVAGTSVKIFPATTTVTGDFSIMAGASSPTFGTGTFVYAAGTALVQRVAAANYYNLTLTGNRGGKTIALGNSSTFNTIDIANNFVVTATNYTATGNGYNTINFSSTSTVVPQNIPGFTYDFISNSGNGLRVYDPLGSANAANVINCRVLNPSNAGGATLYTLNVTTGSKVKMTRTSVTNLSSFPYYDFELTGNLGGANLSVSAGQEIRIAGAFTFTATNYNLISNTGRFFYNGTGNQTITAYNYNDLWISGTAGGAGTRTVTLQSSGTIGIRNTLVVTSPSTFTAGNGFVVTGSTVNFNIGSSTIPVLPPLTAGGNNYHHLTVTGGTRLLAGDLSMGGDVTVNGTDANPAQLTIGNNASNRVVTIAGNLGVTGTSASSLLTAIVDFNSVNRVVTLRLAGNLSISGTSQVLTGNAPLNLKGTILFNGTNQQYTNTAVNKNKYLNYIVGDGTNPTTLTLNNTLELTRSGNGPFSDTLTVAANSILNTGTKNIKIGIDTLPGANNAAFNLSSGATFSTANTGVASNTAIEGTAADGTTGTILSGSLITRSYNAGANYILNGATVNPFPAAIITMANLTIGAPVSLNRAITATGTLDVASFTLTQAGNDLQFSGLTSTTGNIYADKSAALSISGSAGTVGTLRFATPGGNITGQFTINRAVTITLGTDLTIDKTPLTGNLITGTATSILDINGNTLTINGTVSGPGTLSGSNTSNLSLGGAAGTINFTTAKQILKNLTLVGTATALLGTPLDITGGLTPGNEGTVSVTGTAVLSTGGNLTLKSNVNGTARVAAGAVSGGYISGDVTVERYLASIRAWRFLAVPTYGQTIKQSWQENQLAGVDPGTGYGTNLTSNSASWLANGFDFKTNGNSLLIYNTTTNIWDGATNTNVQISGAGANKSYMVFSRGNRSVGPAVGVPPTPVLLRTKGTLFQGDLPAVALPTAGQFAAIGNNYAAAIDFTALANVNIDQSFSVWDPKIPGASGLGGWVTFSASTATPWVPVPAGGSYAAGVPNTRIESGQAFSVHSTSGSGSVTLKESSKLSGSRLVLRPSGNTSVKQSITTNLYNTNTGTANIADANVVVFSDDYSNAVDSRDAIKMNNFGDNFGIATAGQTLVVDARQPVTSTDTVFFNMKKVKLQSYRLECIAQNFDNSLVGFLEDNFLHTSTAINMTGTTTYDFSVNSEAGAVAPGRFRIVFKSPAPLPVTFTSITAIKNTAGITVEWFVGNELNISGYEIERSADGISFSRAGSTAANGLRTGGSARYHWLDVHAAAGDYFYRIKSLDTRGTAGYSRIVKVSGGKENSGFTVYPNPVTKGIIGLQLKNLPAGVYTAHLINNSGQVVSNSRITHFGGNATKTIIPRCTMADGNYQLEITGADNQRTVINVLVQHNP